MSRQEDEVERIRRIRDQQLAARDPRAKERAVFQKVSQRRKVRSFTFKNILADFQAKWTWMAVGGIAGALAAIAINLLFKAQWAEYVGYVMVAFGIVVGRLCGAVRDWGDEGWGRK